MPNLLVIARCAACGGNMREKSDQGAFSKAPLGRLWSYECDSCGRKRTFVSQTSPIEQALAAGLPVGEANGT
jgi:hypothetical protein